jgi:hypothetical protein
LVFNFRETENLLFSYFDVSWTFWTSILSGIFTASIFLHEKHLERLYHTRGTTRLKQAQVARPLVDRATQACLALDGRLISVFLWTPLFREKRDALFSINFLGGGGGGTLPPPPEGLIYYSRRREIAAIDAIDSSSA